MSVEANIVVNEVANARLVPAEAVKNGMVIRVVDGRAKYTPVEVGIKGAGLVDIKNGLDAGDVLVSPFDAGIGPNESLRPKQQAAE